METKNRDMINLDRIFFWKKKVKAIAEKKPRNISLQTLKYVYNML